MITLDSDAVIDPVSFKEVPAAGGVNAATIGKADKGLVVALRIAKKDRIPGQYRGGSRYFSSLDDAGLVLIQHGIYQWKTDTDGWVPHTLARAGKRTNGGMASAVG